MAFICFSTPTDKATLVPCTEQNRHICLQNGSVILCSTDNRTKTDKHADKFTKLPPLKSFPKLSSSNHSSYTDMFQSKNKTSRSKDLPADEILVQESDTFLYKSKLNHKEKHIRICRSSVEDNRVVYCGSDLAYKELCISAADHTIGNCEGYKPEDIPMSVCVQVRILYVSHK